jgi:hypothetical protein
MIAILSGGSMWIVVMMKWNWTHDDNGSENAPLTPK